MKAIDEANEIADEKFDRKPNEVCQEFQVLVRVTTSSNDPSVIRDLLDLAILKLNDISVSNKFGSISTAHVEPK